MGCLFTSPHPRSVRSSNRIRPVRVTVSRIMIVYPQPRKHHTVGLAGTTMSHCSFCNDRAMKNEQPSHAMGPSEYPSNTEGYHSVTLSK